MLWLLCGVSYTQSIASAYNRNSCSASWGYQPLHSVSSSMNTTVYGGTVTACSTTKGTYSASSIHSGISSQPNYRFQSTSILINSMNMAGPRMIDLIGDNMFLSGEDDDEDFPGIGGDDNPIGEVPDPLPIGETPWLIMAVLAAGYIAIRYLRRRNA